MLRLPSPRGDERAADALEDLASALDAGLGPDQLGLLPHHRAAAGPDMGATQILEDRGVRLAPAEALMLEAGGQAGNLPASLRARAAARRLRAEMVRRFWSGLRYPLVLLAVALMASCTVAMAFGSLAPVVAAGAAILLVVLALVFLARSLQRPGGLAVRLPLVGPVLHDLGELPYLQALHGLYSAGMPLLQAHPKAADAVPVAAVRVDLHAADRILQQQQPLTDALAGAGALSAESRSLIATGETAGDLEGALLRAAQRRADVLQRRLDQLVRWGTTAVYALAVALALFVIVSFYSSYLGRFRMR